MSNVKIITNISNEFVPYEAEFRARRARMEANKCHCCGEVIQSGELFCNDDCLNRYYKTPDEPERDFAMERSKLEAQREDARDAQLEKLREEHKRDEAWQLRYEERVEANPRVDEEDQDENE